MKANFGKNSKHDKLHTELTTGNFEDMVKHRKEHLPDIEESIQKILDNYSGQSITIIVQHEDENGLPDHAEMMMGGTSRMECQFAMAKALDVASTKAMEVLMESSKGDVSAMLQIASMLVKDGKDK